MSIAFPGATLTCGSCGLTNPIAFEFIANVGGSATKDYPLSSNRCMSG